MGSYLLAQLNPDGVVKGLQFFFVLGDVFSTEKNNISNDTWNKFQINKMRDKVAKFAHIYKC